MKLDSDDIHGTIAIIFDRLDLDLAATHVERLRARVARGKESETRKGTREGNSADGFDQLVRYAEWGPRTL